MLRVLRVLWFVGVVAVLIVAAVWLAENPGNVTIGATIPGRDWPHVEITTSVGVLLAFAAAVAILLSFVYEIWRWLRTGPRRLVSGRAARRREQGFLALTRGLVAVAAGDAKAAKRFGRRSGRLLDNPLSLLVLAQSAQLNGDEAAARRHFRAMLDHSETEFLGLRGLLVQATKAGDWGAALGYAQRAYALRPSAEWVSSALFDLEVRAGNWRAAQKTLEAAVRHKHVGPADAPRRRAVVLIQRARVARAAGRDEEALRLAREAHKLAPDLVAATVVAAELLIAAGKARAAAAIIEEGWTIAPHPRLAGAYAAIAPEETAMQRAKRIERLHARAPDHLESQIAAAEAALAADLWGTARGHLEAAARGRPTQRVFRLMATLEERDGGDAEAIRSWLLRAAGAPPDAAWRCDQCGMAADEWGTRCESCGAFDSLAWRPPRALSATVAPSVTVEPIAADSDAPGR